MGELCVVFLFWKFDAGFWWWFVFILFVILQILNEMRKIRRRWVENKQYEQMREFYKDKKNV